MLRRVLAAALLATGATAQIASSSPGSGAQYAVNIPAGTASSKSGPIYFQMVAPSGTTWLGLGQGSSMSGSNLFIMYADGNGNVTVSPRLGQGTRQPVYDSSTATQITVLAGQSNSDGSMVANIRCDGCISWSGGSMDPTSSSSSWIWSIKTGSPVDSTDLGASLQQHDNMGNMQIDLTTATGGSSSDPFVSSSSSSTSAAPASSTTIVSTSGTAVITSVVQQSTTASVTNVVPVATGSSSSSSSSSSHSNPNATRQAHGTIMALLFLFLFPLFALTLYLPWAKRVRFVHAPLQIISIILLIVGLVLGVNLAKTLDQLNGYHQVIGYIIFACLVFFQPAMGIYQHLYYHRTGERSAFGAFHQWLGRIVILAGVVNGGLGFMQSGPVGSTYVPRGAVTGYSIIAVVMFLIYITVVFISKRRAQNSPLREKPYDRGYEMHPSSRETTASPTNPNYQSRNYRNNGWGQQQR